MLLMSNFKNTFVKLELPKWLVINFTSYGSCVIRNGTDINLIYTYQLQYEFSFTMTQLCCSGSDSNSCRA